MNQRSSKSTGKGGAPIVLEPVGGAMPLDSRFYVERAVDREFHGAIRRRDSIVLLKGARQVGKTSLLARGVARARESGAAVILTDFQKFSAEDMRSVGSLFRALADAIADRLELTTTLDSSWDSTASAAVLFERFFLDQVMGRLPGHVVWAIDEADRLFTTDYASDVFGLFRAWHNERSLEPGGPFPRLTLAIAHATEAYLFITQGNLSPFNVGTRLELSDFTLAEVAELNRRYGSPLRNRSELDRFYGLVGGQPFLVRRSLHELVTQPSSLAQFADRAMSDEGIFGDHLRRMMLLLSSNRALVDVLRQILMGQPCSNWDGLHRLRSAGLLVGGGGSEPARPRCQLYADYLGRHLA